MGTILIISENRVLVSIIGNPQPVAIGKWNLDNSEKREGVAVKIMHRYGDALWEQFSPDAARPAGFFPDRVESLVADDSRDQDADDNHGCRFCCCNCHYSPCLCRSVFSLKAADFYANLAWPPPT